MSSSFAQASSSINHVPIINVDKQLYPVEEMCIEDTVRQGLIELDHKLYCQLLTPRSHAALFSCHQAYLLQLVEALHRQFKRRHSILVFLPGFSDICELADAIQENAAREPEGEIHNLISHLHPFHCAVL